MNETLATDQQSLIEENRYLKEQLSRLIQERFFPLPSANAFTQASGQLGGAAAGGFYSYVTFLEKIADTTPCMIAVYDTQSGVYQYVNRYVSELLGYTPEDWLGLTVADVISIIHPDDVQGLMEKNGAALQEANTNPAEADNRTFDFEYRVRHANGEWRWIHTRGRIFTRDQQGNVLQIFNVSTDIHDLKMAEERQRELNSRLEMQVVERTFRLMESEARRKEAQLISRMGDWEFDPVTENMTWSEQMFRILGLDPENALPGLQELCTFLEEPALFRSLLSGSVATGEPFSMDLALRLSHGQQVWVQCICQPVADVSGRCIRLFGTFLDITGRKEAEAALRRSEEQYRLITDALPVLISYVDADQRYRFVNKAYADWFRRPLSEITGLNVAGLNGEKAYAILEPHIQQALQGNACSFSYLHPFSDTEYRYMEERYVPHLENGVVKGYYVLSVDVTESHRTNEALRSSEERYRVLAEALPQMIWTTGPLGRVEYANRWLWDYFGYSSLERLNHNFTSWLHPEEAPSLLRLWRQALKNKTTFQVECRLRRPLDGAYIWHLTRATPVLGDDNEIRKWVGVTVDIHQQKELEKTLRDNQALREAEKMLRAQTRVLQGVLSHLPVILYKLDDEAVFRQLEGSGLAKAGLCNTDFLGQPASQLFKEVESELTRACEGETVTFSSLIGGEEKNHYFLNYCFFDVEQNCVVGIAIDNTEQKEVEEALQEKNAALLRSNSELEQFAYVASHDLQEPLRMISNFTQLLSDRYSDKLGQDAREFIGFAREGASRMSELIHDLLEYARVGRGEHETGRIPLSSVLQIVTSNLSETIEETGAQIVYDTLPAVPVPRTQLVQLFQNLIGNALKFRGESAPLITITVSPADTSWLFCVKDNGLGIENHQLERIFVIFQRLHRRTDYPGTGIGLSICKKIVEHHRGRIWAESVPGQGSSFYFTLPAV